MPDVRRRLVARVQPASTLSPEQTTVLITIPETHFVSLSPLSLGTGCMRVGSALSREMHRNIYIFPSPFASMIDSCECKQ